MVECLAERDAQRMDMLLTPLAGALGATSYTSGRVDVPGRERKQPGKYADMSEKAVKGRAMKRDARIYASAAKHGIRVYEVSAGSDSSSSG